MKLDDQLYELFRPHKDNVDVKFFSEFDDQFEIVLDALDKFDSELYIQFEAKLSRRIYFQLHLRFTEQEGYEIK